MTGTTTYRTPTAADIPALAALGRETFVATFGHLYTDDDLQAFLAKAFSIEGVTSDWSDPNQIYRIAEVDGAMVGYCKIALKNGLGFEAGDRFVMELKQLYMRASFQGSGVAAALMEWALEEARSRKADDMVLSVWIDNPRARRFYERYGFRFVRDFIFMVGKQEDHDLLYHLKLKD